MTAASRSAACALQNSRISAGAIRRPLFVLAVFFALGIVLGRYVHLQTVYIACAVLFASAAFVIGVLLKLRFTRSLLRRVITLLLAGVSALSAASLLSSNAYDFRYIEVSENMCLEGRVYSEPYVNDYGSTVCLIDETRIDGRPCGNVKLYITQDNKIECGDVITATADIEIPKGVRNPGGFDEKLYLLSQGISYKAYAQSAHITGSSSGPVIAFTEARRYISGVIDGIFEGDTAPVAKGMLLGDKHGLDEQTYTAFKDTGMAHILAVSGLHAAMLIGFIYYILKLLKAGRTPRLIATLAFIILYAFVTGLTPSIVRASIMASALLIGTYFGRQNDTLDYLSLAFIISLIISPLDLFTAGFQLSFAAVFGILTIGWQVKRLWTKALKKRLPRVGSAISASAGASAGTLPILAFVFNRVSTLSIFINLLIIPLAGLATVLVFVTVMLGAVLGEAAAFAAFPASLLIRLMLFIIQAAASVSFAAVNTAAPSVIIIISSFIIMYLCSKYLLISVKLKAAISGVLAAAVIAAVILTRFSGLYIVFLDTGQGDAAFIKTEQGGEYFIDGGREASGSEVVSFTVRNGYAPHAAFVSHTDEDHFSGIKALYNKGLLNKVYCSWQEEDEVKAALPLAEVIPLGAGDTVWLDGHTKALVLYPYRDTLSRDKNDASLVLMVEYKGKRVLFTGDISGVTETEIFAPLDKVDIYKAAHHGSRKSSYRLPLSVLHPKYSVICVGNNRYGQPDALAAANLSDYSGGVYITMDDYAVEFYIKESITVKTYGGGE